jgi:DNA-directed RNA polymerase subunit RPC12/RpoP
MEKNDNVLEGIECPRCHSQGPFRGGIVAYGMAHISDDGWEDLSTEETEFSGPFKCLECGHSFDPYPDEGEPHEPGECDHEADAASIAYSGESDIVDINCAKCGISGSFRITDVEVMW